MKKLVLPVVSALLFSSFIVGCGSSQQANSGGAKHAGDAAQKDSKPITLKLGTIREDSDPTTMSAKKFAEIVEKQSNGKIKIQVFSNSTIGGINDMFTGMQSGTVDMMYEGISSYGWLEGAKSFNIMSAPFLWKSYDQMVKVMDTDDFKKMFDQAAATTGVRVIKAAGDTEPRELTANKPIKTAEDFKGVKIRTAEAQIVQETMKKLGAQPVVIPFADLYMGLRQGVADAQENGFITDKNKSFFEVQKYVMKTDYIRDVKAWYISEKLWKSLSDEQKKIMTDAAVEAGKYQTDLTNKQIGEALEFLKTKMQYVEPDQDSIRKKLDGALDQFDGQLWEKGLLKKVQDLQSQAK
jgi:tripartite ATP-independent transporter DctP family solute receptor